MERKVILAVLVFFTMVLLLSNTGRLLLVLKPGVSVVAPEIWVPGRNVSVKVLTFSMAASNPVSSRVEAYLVNSNGSKVAPVFKGLTGDDGSLYASLRVPNIEPGAYKLVVKASGVMEGRVEVPVRIRRSFRVLITTDKPWYQPGQTLHFRALVWEANGDYRACPNTSLTVSLVNPDGVRVFKRFLKTDEYGVAFCNIPLSKELKQGRYRVRVEIGDYTQEVTVNIREYVLPKFKVELEFQKKWYLLGEKIYGRVNASYFFGKPVVGNVTLSVQAYTGEWTTVWQYYGSTNREGLMSFTFDAPSYLVGLDISRGKAEIVVNASVIDGSGHVETASRKLVISDTPFIVGAVTLKKEFMPGEDYPIYFVVRYPDGKPVGNTTLNVEVLTGNGSLLSRHTLLTDQAGVASLSIAPPDTGEIMLLARCLDAQGYYGEYSFSFRSKTMGERFIVWVRSDKPSYKVGEEMDIKVLVKEPSLNVSSKWVYLDVISPLDKSTLYTGSERLEDGVAEFKIVALDTYAPYVLVRAYAIGPDMEFYADWLKVDVQPKRDMKVEVEPDKDEYLPGEDCRIRIAVSDADGNEVRDCVVCISIVDSSLLALAEQRPGFEEVFYTLSEEYQEVQWEIHELESVNEFSSLQMEIQRAENLQKRINTAMILAGISGVAATPTIALLAGLYYLLTGRKSRGKVLVAIGLLLQVPIALPSAMVLYTIIFRPRGGILVERWGVPRPVMMGPEFVRKGVAPEVAGGDQEVYEEASSREAGSAAQEVRWFFPETLFWSPSLPVSGHAEVNLVMAHTITTWSVKAIASTKDGRIAVGQGSIRVFKDFFVEPDIPLRLTQDDEISLRVAVYNYAGRELNATLRIKPEKWFRLLDDGGKRVTVPANSVMGVYWRIKALEPGLHYLTVYAEAADRLDAVRRQVKVEPNGLPMEINRNGDLKSDVSEAFLVHPKAIRNATEAFVRISPGYESMFIGGLEALIGFPGGCNEQVSSRLIPDILILNYLDREGKLTPELRAKLEAYAQTGLQTLVSRQHPSGGMGWYATDEDNLGMSAWILNTFGEAEKAGFDIDDRVVERLQAWIMEQQNQDGSFPPVGFYGHGSYKPDEFVMTGFVLRGLLRSGVPPENPKVAKALNYLRSRVLHDRIEDSYGLALSIVCFKLADVPEGDQALEKAVSSLLSLAVEDEYGIHFPKGSSFAGDTENTAYAGIALVMAGGHHDMVRKIVDWLVKHRSPGGWIRTTSDTCGFLELLVRIAERKGVAEADATITITVNGLLAYSEHVTPETSDVERIFPIAAWLRTGMNNVTIRLTGKGLFMYQLVVRQWLRDNVTCLATPLNQRARRGEIFQLNVTVTPPGGDLTPVMVRVTVRPPMGLQVLGGGTRYITELREPETVTLYFKAEEEGTYTINPTVEYMLLYQGRYGGNLKAEANPAMVSIAGEGVERRITVEKHVETIAGIPVTMVGVPVKVRLTVTNREHRTLTLRIRDPLPAGFISNTSPSQLDKGVLTFHVTVEPGGTAVIEYEATGLIPGDYIFPGPAALIEGRPVAVGNPVGITVSDKPLIIRRELDSTMISQGGTVTVKVYVAYLGIPSITGQLPTINMLFITIGLPPGFTVNITSLEEAISTSPYLERYEVHSPTRIDFLTGAIKPGVTFTFQFKIQAKYPLKATVPPASVQDYYNPENRYQTSSQTILVTQ